MTNCKLLGLLLCAGNAFGGILVYTSQRDFDAAAAAVATQTFEGLAAGHGVLAHSLENGLTHATAAAILPGLRMDATTWLGGDLAISGAAVFANHGRQGAELEFTFADGANAISLRTLTLPAGAGVTVSVYGTAGNLLGTYSADGFIGFTTTGTIGKVRVGAERGASPGVDRVQFGAHAIVLPATTTSLGTSSFPVFYGQPVTLTATVAPANATGAVEFLDGATVLGNKKLNAGQAQISTMAMPSGTNTLRAVYGGAAGMFQPSQTSLVTRRQVTPVQGAGFQNAVNYAGSDSLQAVAVGDFNGDGKLDMAVTNESDAVEVFLGNGDGSFQAAAYYHEGGMVNGVAVGDFNGDGVEDLAVSNSSSFVAILLGNPDGTFQTPATFPVEHPTAVAVGDFNGDGNADLALSAEFGAVFVLLGNGDGTFQAALPNFSNDGRNAYSVVVADFDGDGKADLAAEQRTSVFVLMGNGDGTFQLGTNYPAAGNSFAVAVGDFNRDGKPDLAVPDSAAGVSVLLGNGDGTFQTAAPYNAGINPLYIAVGDFDGDGNPDLAVTQQLGGVNVLLGIGDGTFQTPVLYGAGNRPLSIAAGDFNGDGGADLAVPDQFNGVNVLLNAAPAMLTLGAGSTPQSAITGQAFAVPLSVTVKDSSGNPVPGAFVRFTAPSSGAGGTFPNTSTTQLWEADGSGASAIPFAANATAGGPYIVTASAGVVSAQFVLTNLSVCDVGRHGAITVSDAQYMIGEALGTNMPTNDLNADGVVNGADVQIVLNGVLTGSCQ